jgi:hypothetical protein
VTSHHEALAIQESLIQGLTSGFLHIRDVSTAADKIVELTDSIDTDNYPLYMEELMGELPELAEALSWYLTSQLSLPDKYYAWDEPNARRLVGETTEVDIRNALHSLMALYEHTYENLEVAYVNFEYDEGSGWMYKIEIISEIYLGNWIEWCNYNQNGKFLDGIDFDTGEEDEYYLCLSGYQTDYYSDGKYDSFTTGFFIYSDSGLEDKKLFVVDVSQFLAVFLSESERAVTNMVFVGAKKDRGDDVALEEVRVVLVPAYGWPGNVEDIQCGVLVYDEVEETRVISEDVSCETEVDNSFSNRVVCTCEVDSGWIVGYISADEALLLIEEEANDGEFEVAFAARATVSVVLGLFYLLLA